MTTIAQNITAIAEAKTNLAANLTTKGVTSADTEPLATLVGKILDIPSGGGEYSPPADWIDISDVSNGNINLLVCDSIFPYYGFTVVTDSGTVHINWGDGVEENFNSNALAAHQYTIGAGQACSRGYTTFKIIISPNSGHITAFRVFPLNVTKYGQRYGILSVYDAATYTTSMWAMFASQNSPGVTCPLLESFIMVGTFPSCTDASNSFSNCSSLINVDVRGLVAVTTISYMFNGCLSLVEADLSGIVTATVSCSNAFYNCASLQKVDISGLTGVSSLQNMFLGCSSLKEVDTSHLTPTTSFSAAYMFWKCKSLQHVDISGLGLINNSSNMFYECSALGSVTMCTLDHVTDSSYMFYYCIVLPTIDAGGMIVNLNAASMFASCESLYSVDISDMLMVTNASSLFNNCYSLVSITNTNFARDSAGVTFSSAFNGNEFLTAINFPSAKMTALTATGSSGKLCALASITMNAASVLNATTISMDIQYNTLTAAQLDTIFTSLPTVTGKTIRITGCTGAATCTRSIATAKGWTVTG